MKAVIVAAIPCYNEEGAIADLVTRARQYVDKVIVADDASVDRTGFVSQEAGAMVVKSVRRMGFGGNVAAGICLACAEDADIVVTLDGDGQHNPDEIPQVLEPILNDKADLVIGSRFLGDYDVPRYRKFGIDIITWLYNVGEKQKVVDAQSCFRAYSRKLLDAVDTKEWGFGFSTEILIKARVQGFRIREVPISCIYHEEFRMNSSMNPIKQGLEVALSTVKWRFRLKNGGKGT